MNVQMHCINCGITLKYAVHVGHEINTYHKTNILNSFDANPIKPYPNPRNIGHVKYIAWEKGAKYTIRQIFSIDWTQILANNNPILIT